MPNEQPAAVGRSAADRGFTFRVPVHFHDLGMHLTDQERWEHLDELACEIWSGGTTDQRQGVRTLYADIADAAAEDGALYAGVALFATEDDRISTASLIVRADPIDDGDPEMIVATLQETLSLNPSSDVRRVEAEAGSAVLAFTGVEWQPQAPEDAAGDPPPLTMARVEAYLPLPDLGTLVVLALTTSSLPELPDYVALLAQTTESVRRLDETGPAGLPAQSNTEAAERVEAAFG
ncbi:hypothetical protein AB0D08_29205 [Kitasatospora sp. NPDC048540]|uniref:hypothetical protein n=1 Tax=unclassified Kitasatospora TaxID=2633591 RepID=UPI0006908993|nr:hypothetical protein [Kitasatospora sp. MBT63]